MHREKSSVKGPADRLKLILNEMIKKNFINLCTNK